MRTVKFYDSNNKEIEFRVNKSFNKGSRYNKLIRESLIELGFGRSILVDNNNNVLCGHNVIKEAMQCGKKKVVIVETDGEELVVVKRKDVEPDSVKSYEISLVDNLLSNKNIIWDSELIIQKTAEKCSFNPKKWNGAECMVEELNIEELLKDDVQIRNKSLKTSCEYEPSRQLVALFD